MELRILKIKKVQAIIEFVKYIGGSSQNPPIIISVNGVILRVWMQESKIKMLSWHYLLENSSHS